MRDATQLDWDPRVVAYDHPDAIALVAAVQQVYVHRYGKSDVTPVATDEFAPPAGMFLVGYSGGVPLACGGWRLRGGAEDPVLRDGDVELKRMYVVDAMRGRGLARRLLAELERRAVAAGARRIVLETGTRQPEAIQLYRSSGYREVGRFGAYRCHPLSRCFAKPLP
jgi:GNAT superfamily N-acetyltransferase